MPAALLFDIHGNLPALEAVLADARAAGAGEVALGGDLALFGGWPAETVEVLRGLHLRASIRGNGERWSAAPTEAPDDPVVQSAIRACRALLGEEAIAKLGALPFDARLDQVRMVHGSPRSDVRSFLPLPAPDEEELLADAGADVLMFGHTHLQFERTAANGTRLVNPGSVGMPCDGDHRAAYALLHEDGTVELRRVPYDHAASAAQVREAAAGAPWGDVVARRIEQAAFVS